MIVMVVVMLWFGCVFGVVCFGLSFVVWLVLYWFFGMGRVFCMSWMFSVGWVGCFDDGFCFDFDGSCFDVGCMFLVGVCVFVVWGGFGGIGFDWGCDFDWFFDWFVGEVFDFLVG